MNTDGNQDANPADSSAAQVEETQSTDQINQDSSSQSNTDQASSSPQQDANPSADPKTGLPPKENLYGEFRRKIFDEIVPVIQGSVREAMLGHTQNQPNQTAQKPEMKYQGKYSSRELENILSHPSATESDKLFANRGLAYIEARQDTMQDIETRSERNANESRQTQALQGIVKDYPQVFNPQTNQWNFADPLWQKTMAVYNSRAELKQFGNEGLRVAMDSAYSSMAREGQVTLKKNQIKVTSQQRQIDKSQSQAMQAGTLTPGKQNGADNSKTKIMETWKKNPDSEDAKRAALAGLIPKSWLT